LTGRAEQLSESLDICRIRLAAGANHYCFALLQAEFESGGCAEIRSSYHHRISAVLEKSEFDTLYRRYTLIGDEEVRGPRAPGHYLREYGHAGEVLLGAPCSGKGERLFATAGDGHQEVAVCEAIMKSNKAKSWVKV
jgi:predicted dehydrogenase